MTMTLEELLFAHIKEQQLYPKEVTLQSKMSDLGFDQYDVYDILSDMGMQLGFDVGLEDSQAFLDATAEEVLNYLTKRVLQEGNARR